MSDEFKGERERIKKVILGCPYYYKEHDIIREVCNKVRIRKDTVKKILKNI